MILVDYRSGSKEVAPHIHVPHKIAKLDYGDFSLLGQGPGETIVPVGVERKTVMDLVSSMVDGRLSGHQLHGLLDMYDHVYLVVEGLWRPRQKDGMLERWSRGHWHLLSLGQRRFMARDIGNYLNTLAVVCGIKVWRTDSIAHTGRWLSDLHGWWTKGWEKHQSHMQHYSPPAPTVFLRKPKIVQRVAKEFKGVGWDKAGALARVFPTVVDLVLAREGDLRKAAGVGKGLAASIRKEITNG